MLEEMFRTAEEHVSRATSAARSLVQGLQRIQASLKDGDLRRARKALADLEATKLMVTGSLASIHDVFSLDEEAYLSSPGFLEEVVMFARQQGIQVFTADGALYSYPISITVASKEKALAINGKRDQRLRPSLIVGAIVAAQKEPVRFKPQAFLESLYSAYKHLCASGAPADSGTVIPLVKIYELLTLLPEQARKYTKPEFAQDVYLLDKSGVTRTKSGERLSFPASTGTRSIADTLATLSETGEQKRYYGIAFELSQGVQT